MKINDFIINNLSEDDWVNNLIIDGINELNGEYNNSYKFFPFSVLLNISCIKYPDLSENQLSTLYSMEREVLITSKRENNYNEVSITYDMTKDKTDDSAFIKIKGTENSVNFFNNSDIISLFDKTDDLCIVNLHNHPNNSDFSIRDLLIFSNLDQLKIMEIINTKGEISFLYKPYKIDLSKIVLQSIVETKQNIEDIKDIFDNITNEEHKQIVKKCLDIFQEKGVIYSPYLNKKQALNFKFPDILTKQTDKNYENDRNDEKDIEL